MNSFQYKPLFQYFIHSQESLKSQSPFAWHSRFFTVDPPTKIYPNSHFIWNIDWYLVVFGPLPDTELIFKLVKFEDGSPQSTAIYRKLIQLKIKSFILN